MSAAETLLSRLAGVRDRGQGQWLAQCPAHKDKSPSLSVKETDDGRILLHDFAGCAPADIVAALGLEMTDLFPDRPAANSGSRRSQHRLSHRDALRLLRREAFVVSIAAGWVRSGTRLTDKDMARVNDAAVRIAQVADAAGVPEQ